MTEQAFMLAASPAAAPGRAVWLVPHPTHQYVEDVKALARQHGLEVVDTAVASAAEIERATALPPQLTLRPDVALTSAASATADVPVGGQEPVGQVGPPVGAQASTVSAGSADTPAEVQPVANEAPAAAAATAAKTAASVSSPRKGAAR